MLLSAKFNYKLLGKAMKVVRQLKGYKQEYVSAKTGIPQSMYSKVERGESHLYIDKLIAVCEVLEVSPLLLLYCAGYTKAYPFEQTIQKETDFIKNVLERINNGGGGVNDPDITAMKYD